MNLAALAFLLAQEPASRPRPDDAPKPPAVGEEAPDFALRDQQGKTVRLSSYRGRSKVVLAFYPKDFTPG